MFGMDFYEIAVIGVVALVVLGPERLPKVARTAGHLFGRLQRYVNGVKADISREMEASEFAKLRQEVQDAAKSFEKSVNEQSHAIAAEAKAIQIDAEKSLADKTASAAATPADTTAANTDLSNLAAPDIAVPPLAPQVLLTQAEIIAAEDAVFANSSAAILTSSPSNGAALQAGVQAFSSEEASRTATFGQGAFDFGIEPSPPRQREAARVAAPAGVTA